VKITRIYTGDDSQSHFEDVEIAMVDIPTEATGGVMRSAVQSAKSISFRYAPADSLVDWHPAPRRQYVINISGEVEYEMRDGTKRRFGPGSILLCEDLTGGGHVSRGIGNTPRVSIYVPLAD
jgi:hypothetical protein